MILSIAWKNIWRNKLRSIVVITAMSFGLLSGIFSVAVMNGFLISRVDTVIRNEVSSLQLHDVHYLENNELQHTIPDADQMLDQIRQLPQVEAVSKRLKIEAMISSARAATGATIIGVEPEIERQLSDIDLCIADSNGTYFEGMKRNPILISAKLAERLKVRLRKSISIQTVDKNGDIVGENFRVVGIYKSKNAMFDEMNVFIRFSDMQRLLNLADNEAHEIAILTRQFDETDSLKALLSSDYTRYAINSTSIRKAVNDSLPANVLTKLSKLSSEEQYSYEGFQNLLSENLSEEEYREMHKRLMDYCETGINVMDWMELAPDVKMASSYMDYMMVIFVGIILLALGFGIVNTMLMAVLERVKELGMLMAVGMNNRKVFRMIMVETIWLCLSGGVIGMGLSAILLVIVGQKGLDLSMLQEGFEAMGYSTHIYPAISTSDYLQVTLMVVLIGILASIYPAIRAIRLNPAEAVRSE